ncbi:MAG: cyclic beta 1-2 glucan synthetase, partial [Burkholderiaceae bacterium]
MLRNTHGFRARVMQVAGRWWENAWAISAFDAEPGPAPHEEPLRAELFSAEQMERHGRRLAALHVLGAAGATDRLLARLASNERVLVDLNRRLAATAEAERRFSPAAEWLLDNFYLIQEEIRTARRHLPQGYSRQLPRLAQGPDSASPPGVPRVYHLALQLVAHGDGAIGRGTLMRFIAAYQSVQPLLLGELWAIPIMLRLALIENLRRVAARVATAHAERETAGVWADSMVQVAENAPSDLILIVADMARSALPLTNAFVAEFARRLQGHGASLALPLTWMELRLAEAGQTIQQLVQMEGQQQAANQVSVSNSIGSLRLLGTMDWREFVEALSGVEQTLRDDPSGAYGLMDFETRDRYRHAVEAIAKVAEVTEADVARRAVALCTEAGDETGPMAGRRRHVGFHLLGAGREALERAVG